MHFAEWKFLCGFLKKKIKKRLTDLGGRHETNVSPLSHLN